MWLDTMIIVTIIMIPPFCCDADPKIALLGAMQALFEASMYTFVFLWTPALSPKGESIPHGMIFSCFMVASMAGSALAGRLLTTTGCASQFRATERDITLR
jgi:hypothetical protein